MKRTLPHVVVTSFLGARPELREMRLKYHLRQRAKLRECWPDWDILSVCSAYDKKERKALALEGFRAEHHDARMFKWEKQNLWLPKLYAQKELTAVLFLDDDIVPRDPNPEDFANGMVDCAKLVRFWVENPEQMMAPMAYFASVGLRFDAFYKSQKVIVGEAPPVVMSWAMMMRSDLGVLYTKELVTDEKTGLYDDLPFRVKCWADGKPVVKHGRAFFKTYQSIQKTVEQSTWFDSQEQRVKTNEVIKKKMMKTYPGFFSRGRGVPGAGDDKSGFGLK